MFLRNLFRKIVKNYNKTIKEKQSWRKGPWVKYAQEICLRFCSALESHSSEQ